jgi:hypothetical protein
MKKIFILNFMLILFATPVIGNTYGSCQTGHNCVCIHYDENQFTSQFTYTDIYGAVQEDKVYIESWQYIDLGDPNSSPNQIGVTFKVEKTNGASGTIYNGPLYNKETLTITGPIGSPGHSISENTCNVAD